MGAVAKSYMSKGFLILYMRNCANIQSYMRRPLVIYDFATAPFSISLYRRNIQLSFLSVHSWRLLLSFLCLWSYRQQRQCYLFLTINFDTNLDENQKVLNDLQMIKLSCCRMIRLLAHLFSPVSRKQVVSLSQSFCVSPFELTDWIGGSEEPVYTTARKPGPL